MAVQNLSGHVEWYIYCVKRLALIIGHRGALIGEKFIKGAQ